MRYPNVLDVAADPEDPGDPDDSEDPDDTEGPEEPKGLDAFKGLDGSKGSGEPRGLGGISAGTGDSVPVLPLAIVVVVALVAAIWARRRSR